MGGNGEVCVCVYVCVFIVCADTAAARMLEEDMIQVAERAVDGDMMRDKVHRWFTDTQASRVLPGGSVPDWFQGFTSRKDAEELLRDRSLGCFLIRLSEKAIGYILSYRGQDRCRHFVINQNPAGLFIITGDCQAHRSLSELIEHYKTSPIEPFGECLTSGWNNESNSVELYDVVKCGPKEKTGVSVQALRNLWDKKTEHTNDHRSDRFDHKIIQQKIDAPPFSPVLSPSLPPPVPSAFPPDLPAKNRKLKGTVSVDTSQALPPVPRRGLPLTVSHSMSGTLPDKTSHHPSSRMLYALVDHSGRTVTRRPSPERGDQPSSSSSSLPHHNNYAHLNRTVPTSNVTYSELKVMDSRCRSLPQLDQDGAEGSSSYAQLSYPSFTESATSNSPKRPVTCQTYSLHDPRDAMRHCLTTSPAGHQAVVESDDRLEQNNPLYQWCDQGDSGALPVQGDCMYAEVPSEMVSNHQLVDNTYEPIPAVQDNTYESLDDTKTKQSKSLAGKNNMYRWWKFLPESKKK